MHDLFGQPIGGAHSFRLTAYQKRQAAILYHYASLDYLKGLIPLIDATIDAFHGVAQIAQDQGRDALFASKRWGVRDTSANADTHGTPFLSALRETTMQQIADVAFESYGQTDIRYAWGGLREVSTDWMSDAEYERYKSALDETYDYASKIDYTMDRQVSWHDASLTQEWLEFHTRFEPLPRFRVRTDVEAVTGRKPPRTGVYVSQDDPNGSLQFAWTGGDGGWLAECSTFNEVGVDALKEIGRADMWFNHAKMLQYVKNSRFTAVFKQEDEFKWLEDDDEIARGLLAKSAFITKPSKWYFVEMISGEFDEDSSSENESDAHMRLRCPAGQPCPREGWWFTPAGEGRRYCKQGEVMPEIKSDYGQTIWCWDEPQG